MLERFGCQVTGKISGSEAIESFKRDPDQFDLVITDQKMPKMDGLKLAEVLLSIRPDIPIIMCTGYAEDMEEGEMKDRGVSELVRKPVDFSELASVAREVLEQRNSGRL
jgi:CheY-like chemotaxis protein